MAEFVYLVLYMALLAVCTAAGVAGGLVIMEAL